MEESLAHKAVKGTVWSAIDRIGVMALQFIVNVVLARLLTPYDFGAVGMLLIFITVSQVFVDSGFGSALIQKKIPSETDYSTIFFWNLGSGISLYVILFFVSPFIADFYNLPILTKILRAIGITLILSCITNIQVNRLQKKLEFKKLAITDILTYIISGGVAIILALWGYGVWSLVWMMILQGLGRVFFLYIVSKWIPKLIFSIQAFKSLFSFGGFLLCANILETICSNLQGIVIGKVFSASQMGYYSQASKLDNIISLSIPQVIAGVMYPIFSQLQDDKEKLRNLIYKNLSIISFIIYPILGTLICSAYPLIKWLYGSQWLPAAPYFQILCVGGFFLCLNNIIYYGVAACGKSKALFHSSLYKWGLNAIYLLIGLQFGMYGLMWSLTFGRISILGINIILAKRYVNVKIIKVLKAIFPSLVVILISGASITLVCDLIPIFWMIKSFLVLLLYVSLSYLLGIKELKYCKNLIKSLVLKY